MNFDGILQFALKHRIHRSLLTGIGALLIAGAAHAQSFRSNLLAFESVNLFRSRIEGPVSVLRDAVFSDYLIGSTLIPSADACHVLVGGYLSFSRGSVPTGTVCVGEGSNLNGVGLLGQPRRLRPNYYEDFRISEEMRLWVQSLFAHGAAWGTVQDEIIALNATRSNSINLFEIPISSLNRASEIRISAAPEAKLIIKVNASSVSFNSIGIKLFGVAPSQVLWYFPQTELLSLSRVEFQGSIMAKNANLDFTDGKIHGSAIVKSAWGNGEYLYNPFNPF